MAPGLEPAFTPGRQVWPLAGRALAGLERDDPDLAIPSGALQNGIREAPERHFAANQNSLITHRPVEPLGPAPRGAADRQRKWKLALLASCIFHAAVAVFFIQATDEAVLMEGADFSGIAYLGDGADQVKAGETSETEEAVDVTMVTMLDAVPVETVEAQAVPVDRIEATDVAEAVAAEVETLKPVEETPVELVRPTDRAEIAPTGSQAPLQAEHLQSEATESRPVPAVTETVPEVLATDRADLVEDDNLVQKPAETQAAEPVEAAEAVASEQAQRSEPAEAAKSDTREVTRTEPVEASKVETVDVARAEPTETKPVEPVKELKPKSRPEAEAQDKPVETKAGAAKPAKEVEKKPAAEKKTAKQKIETGRKVAEKAEARPKKSGDGGQNQANARRGQADGQKKGDSRQASRGGSKNGEVGNAAVSNYPGKVVAKLKRAMRTISKRTLSKAQNELRVAFTVSASGGVSGIRIASSSGSAEVDQAALALVRRAAPFPPIPPEAGRSSWQFAVPLGIFR